MTRKLVIERLPKDFDGQLYINARGWKLAFNLVKVIYLWLTRKRRKGHWYFDA